MFFIDQPPLGLALICFAYGVSWPVRSFVFLDLWNMYVDVIRWKELLNQKLTNLVELKTLCSTMLEWRRVTYAIAFYILWVSFLFRYSLHLLKSSYNYFFRFLLIKCADRGFVRKGKLNMALFKVRLYFIYQKVIKSTLGLKPFWKIVKSWFRFKFLDQVC